MLDLALQDMKFGPAFPLTPSVFVELSTSHGSAVFDLTCPGATSTRPTGIVEAVGACVFSWGLHPSIYAFHFPAS